MERLSQIDRQLDQFCHQLQNISNNDGQSMNIEEDNPMMEQRQSYQNDYSSDDDQSLYMEERQPYQNDYSSDEFIVIEDESSMQFMDSLERSWGNQDEYD